MNSRRQFLKAAIIAPLALSVPFGREMASQLPTSYPGEVARRIPECFMRAQSIQMSALKVWLENGRLAYREIPPEEWYA